MHPRFHPCQRSGARASRGALNYLRAGGKSQTLNCGYGRGYSVREVLDAVTRGVGHPFLVNFTDRREGDITVSVAGATRIRYVLNWKPKFEDLDTIVGHALAWEHKLKAGKRRSARPFRPKQPPPSSFRTACRRPKAGGETRADALGRSGSRQAGSPDFAGFRVRSLRERPGMTPVDVFGLKKAGRDGQGTVWPGEGAICVRAREMCLKAHGR